MARRALGTRKIGHAGTLDPMATGVLVLGVNSATRLLTFLVGADKTYEATIRLGSATVTDDAEGDVISAADTHQLATVSEADIIDTVAQFTGHIHQRPSAVSAIKVDGTRAYDLVRRGAEVALAARPVTVSRFSVLEVRRFDDAIDVDVVVDCSSGTYIRALARDVGERLGIGGHLTALRRTRVGEFGLDRAILPDAITLDAVVPSAVVARSLFPAWDLTAVEERDLRHGKKISVDRPDTERIAAVKGDVLVAVVSVRNGVARVETGFPE